MLKSIRYWAPILIIGILLLAMPGANVRAQAQPPTPGSPVVIYMFWGDGCPHCAKAKPFLEGLARENDRVELRFFEVWYNKDNQQLFKDMSAAYGFEPSAVPTIFVGEQHWVGYNDTTEDEIEQAVKTCLANGCRDAGVGIVPGVTEPTAAPTPAGPAPTPGAAAGQVLNLPLIGKIDLASQSLLVSTLLISFVDGINPCSLWVLSMLLALTLHTGSRKKVVTIGLVFISVTALVYALFIAGLFTIFTVVNFVGWIQAVVALVALFFALVNIKDYFWYKEGISFTIADEKKPGIFTRIRNVMDSSQSLWGLVSATVVLAGGVSLVEFSCTAGFPVLWSNLLAGQKVTAGVFVLLLLVYMLIYQLDELALFFTAVFTLKANRVEEKHGRILKLIGGMLMLSLAIVMIVNPSLMNQLSSTLLIFAIALGATLLVLLVHRVILPRFGIRIGTELDTHRSQRTAKKRH